MPEELIEQPVEETPADSSPETENVEEQIVDPVEPVVEPEPEEQPETEAEKWKRIAEDRERELVKYRKPPIKKLQKEILSPKDSASAFEQEDYKSKMSDVLFEVEDEFNALPKEQQERLGRLIPLLTKQAYDDERKQGAYVAKGKLLKLVSQEITAASGKTPENKRKRAVESERAEAEQAEITATRPSNRRTSNITPNERDRKVFEESDGTIPLERITANRLAAEQREAEFKKTMQRV